MVAPDTSAKVNRLLGNLVFMNCVVKSLSVSSEHEECSARLQATTVILFLPRCIECRRCLTMRILSVLLSVCQTRAL